MPGFRKWLECADECRDASAAHELSIANHMKVREVHSGHLGQERNLLGS
jgi:hypothetical protein